MKRSTRTLAAVPALLLCACASSTHIGEYKAKQRVYEAPPAEGQELGAASPGSLWREGRPSSMLFTDARALRASDIVVIKVEEIADAHRSSDTDLQRQTKMQMDIAAFLQKAGVKSVDIAAELGATSDSQFHGAGTSGRSESLTATVPATVRKVLPNGNLFVEGHRVVLVNNEEQHFYISGVLRPIDIEGDNSVKSSMVAEAEIEFTGRGDLSDNQKQGWLQRHLGWLWPF